ncbi:MAG: hypothetical protein RSC25_05310, partial [Christensenella sp.]
TPIFTCDTAWFSAANALFCNYCSALFTKLFCNKKQACAHALACFFIPKLFFSKAAAFGRPTSPQHYLRPNKL